MAIESEKLVVPAALYDAALEFCNARRHEIGYPAITELPAGLSGRYRECPCAMAVRGLLVGETEYWFNSRNGPGIPHGIAGFVQYFDLYAPCNLPVKPVRAEEGIKCQSRR